MNRLHPDKLVGVARAVKARPRVPNKTPKPGGMQPAGKEPERIFLKSDPKGEEAGSLIEELAYRLRDSHQGSHLNRMARVGENQKAKKPKPSGKGKSEFDPIGMAPANESPIVMFNFGGPAGRRNG